MNGQQISLDDIIEIKSFASAIVKQCNVMLAIAQKQQQIEVQRKQNETKKKTKKPTKVAKKKS